MDCPCCDAAPAEFDIEFPGICSPFDEVFRVPAQFIGDCPIWSGGCDEWSAGGQRCYDLSDCLGIDTGATPIPIAGITWTSNVWAFLTSYGIRFEDQGGGVCKAVAGIGFTAFAEGTMTSPPHPENCTGWIVYPSSGNIGQWAGQYHTSATFSGSGCFGPFEFDVDDGPGINSNLPFDLPAWTDFCTDPSVPTAVEV